MKRTADGEPVRESKREREQLSPAPPAQPPHQPQPQPQPPAAAAVVAAEDVLAAARDGNAAVLQEMIVAAPGCLQYHEVCGVRALWTAAERGHQDAVRVLVEAGMLEVEALEQHVEPAWRTMGQSAVERAAASGHEAVVRYLVCDANCSVLPAFVAALGRGQLRVMQWLFGHDPSACNLNGTTLSTTVYGRTTMLEMAILSDSADAVRWMLQQGANACEPDARDTFPLHFAATHSKVPAMEVLVREFNADINSRDDVDWTPLHHASAEVVMDEFNETPVLSQAAVWLVREGADINATDNEGFTPLLRAINEQNVAVARMLLVEGGADPNIRTEEAVALMGAMSIDDGLARTCVEHGADIHAADECGGTILHLCDYADLENLVFFVAAGADVEAKDVLGRTPLHHACARTRADVVRFFIQECGAKIDVQDTHGDTPLHFACKGHLW